MRIARRVAELIKAKYYKKPQPKDNTFNDMSYDGFDKYKTAYVSFDKHCLWCAEFRTSRVMGTACCVFWVRDGYFKSNFYNTSRRNHGCVYPYRFKRRQAKLNMERVYFKKKLYEDKIELFKAILPSYLKETTDDR